MTKIEAIKHLEKALEHNPEFKKAWQEYLEMIVIEELDNCRLNPKAKVRLPQTIAKRVLRMFQGDWWQCQPDHGQFE